MVPNGSDSVLGGLLNGSASWSLFWAFWSRSTRIPDPTTSGPKSEKQAPRRRLVRNYTKTIKNDEEDEKRPFRDTTIVLVLSCLKSIKNDFKTSTYEAYSFLLKTKKLINPYYNSL